MRVAWTEEALAHLESIHRYISRDAPLYAKRLVDKLTHASQRLIAHPRAGRTVPEYGDTELRELIVSPYRVVYRLKPDRVDIIAVFHGAQQLPDTFKAYEDEP